MLGAPPKLLASPDFVPPAAAEEEEEVVEEAVALVVEDEDDEDDVPTPLLPLAKTLSPTKRTCVSFEGRPSWP